MKTPFIVLSGSMGGDFTEFAKEKGATDCMEKGRLANLKEILQRAIDAQSGGASS
jgi:hypothetical protein